MKQSLPRRTSGFSLIEIAIGISIMGLLFVNVGMVTRTGGRAVRSGIFQQQIEDELEQVLDRSRFALMSSTANNLDPVFTAPLSNHEISFKSSLGFENGTLVESDPESLSWESGPNGLGQMIWTQNPGEHNQRRIPWSKSVPTLHRGELSNEIDDNANGLYDETGVAFHVESQSDQEVQVHIHLTIEKFDPDGKRVPTARSVNVTCRN